MNLEENKEGYMEGGLEGAKERRNDVEYICIPYFIVSFDPMISLQWERCCYFDSQH